MAEQQQPPEVLFEGTGLRIVRNRRNAFVTAWLRFTADPLKRDPKWRAEAASGMTPEQAARELDIDFTALMGAKVFPELHARRSEIVLTSPLPDFGPDARYFGGLDYGMRSPASFHVYTVQDGCFYSVFEVYEPCRVIADFVAKMRQFPHWNQIRYIAADPNLWRLDQQTAGGLVSVESLFRAAGVRCLVKGQNTGNAEPTFIALMRAHWAEDDPTFKFFETCSSQIHEFESAIYVNQSERQLTTANYREEIADHDNHSIDDCKYMRLTNPQEQRGRQFTDPQLVDRWAQSSKRRSSQPQGPPPQRTLVRGYY